jgi:hypothetical protein
MHTLVYIGTALWICVGIVLFVWRLIVFAQLQNHRIPKPDATIPLDLYSTDPALYTEAGQSYLRRSKRIALVLLAYVPLLFIVICIAMSQ